MDFRLRGLPHELFVALFAMTDDELRRHGSERRVATETSIFPCRVSLTDAAPGEEVVLTNFAHVPEAETPGRRARPSIALTRCLTPCSNARCRCAPMMPRT